jgi:hypothetical protein
MAGDLRFATREDVVADVRRVASLLPRPGYMPPIGLYRKHGRYCRKTVLKRLDVSGWREAGEALNLKRCHRWTFRHLNTAAEASEPGWIIPKAQS